MVALTMMKNSLTHLSIVCCVSTSNMSTHKSLSCQTREFHIHAPTDWLTYCTMLMANNGLTFSISYRLYVCVSASSSLMFEHRPSSTHIMMLILCEPPKQVRLLSINWLHTYTSILASYRDAQCLNSRPVLILACKVKTHCDACWVKRTHWACIDCDDDDDYDSTGYIMSES